MLPDAFQVPSDLFSGVGPAGWFWGNQGVHELAKDRRDFRCNHANRWRACAPVDHFGFDTWHVVHAGSGDRGNGTGEALVERCTEGVDVTGGVGRAVKLDADGVLVARGAADNVGGRGALFQGSQVAGHGFEGEAVHDGDMGSPHGGGILGFVVFEGGEAEVDQFVDAVGFHDVARFDVAMDKASLVDCDKGRGDGAAHFEGVGDWEFVAVVASESELMVERGAIQVFHGQAEEAFVGWVVGHGMEADNVGVFDLAEGAGFLENAASLAFCAGVGALRAGAVGGEAEEFDGDGTEFGGAMDFFGEPDGGEASFA